MKKFEAFVVMVEGCVDVDATVENFRTSLEVALEAKNEMLVMVGSAIEKVFDKHVGSTFAMPVLVNEATRHIDFDPSQFGEIYELMAEFVKANRDIYHQGKGKGGGVYRIADCPEKAERAAKK